MLGEVIVVKDIRFSQPVNAFAAFSANGFAGFLLYH
jgi:hypothetical protein